MKKFYVIALVIGALVIGGGAYFVMSGIEYKGFGKASLPGEDEKFLYIQVQRENGTYSNPQVCSYEINSSGISFEVKGGEGENVTPTGLTIKQVSAISIVQYQTSTDNKSIRFRLTKEGSDMLTKITEDAEKRHGDISLYVNGKVIYSATVLSKITSDKIEISLDDVGITKAENILGKDNLKLNCPNNNQ